MMKLLIWAVIVYLLYRAIRNSIRIGGPAGPGAFSKPPEQVDDLMVKDPCCGVYFPRKDGHHLRLKGENLLFCSPECRDKYLKEHSGDGA